MHQDDTCAAESGRMGAKKSSNLANRTANRTVKVGHMNLLLFFLPSVSPFSWFNVIVCIALFFNVTRP
jgi:hypothetical protein